MRIEATRTEQRLSRVPPRPCSALAPLRTVPHPGWARALGVLALLALNTVHAGARAQAPASPIGADVARLRALLPAEREVLMPHLDDGPVMLTEFSNEQTELPAITLMARIHAPAALVADVVSHPENYGAFMPALDEVEVRTRQGLQVAYSWHWTVAIFTLRGDNVMTVYPGHPTRGHLIEVTSTNGDLGVGRFLFRIYPETPDSCVLVFATRIDMRDANYLSQQMASGGNSVNRTINIALSMTMLLPPWTRPSGATATPRPRPRRVRSRARRSTTSTAMRPCWAVATWCSCTSRATRCTASLRSRGAALR